MYKFFPLPRKIRHIRRETPFGILHKLDAAFILGNFPELTLDVGSVGGLSFLVGGKLMSNLDA